MSPKRTEADDFAAKIETLREAEAPNQIALELLKSADEISDLVVIVRDQAGKLHAVWTDQDFAQLTESAMYLTALVEHDLYLEHETPPEEEDDPCEA